jgi:hypothetical protein
LLQNIGFVAKQTKWKEDPSKFDPNINQNNFKLITAIITAGLYPNIIRISKQGSNLRFFTQKEEVYIHPMSVNYKVTIFNL